MKKKISHSADLLGPTERQKAQAAGVGNKVKPAKGEKRGQKG